MERWAKNNKHTPKLFLTKAPGFMNLYQKSIKHDSPPKSMEHIHNLPHPWEHPPRTHAPKVASHVQSTTLSQIALVHLKVVSVFI